MHKLVMGLVTTAFLMGLPTERVIAQPPDFSQLLSRIQDFRVVALRDSSLVDVCSIPDAFQSDGRAVQLLTNIRYRSRVECEANKRTSRAPTVVLENLRRIADTVIISGYFYRGDLKYHEEYRFLIRPTEVSLRYSIVSGLIWH